jgi:transmembrane sensor
MMDPNAPSDAAWEEASAWFTRLRDERAGPGLRAQFLRWLGEDLAHGVAYRAVSDAFAAAQKAREAGELLPVPRGLSRTANANERRRSRSAVALAASVLLIGLAGVWVTFDPLATHYRTGVGETRTITLDDGSTVILAGRSRLSVRMRDSERALHLDDGEALFQVTKDPTRPFRVRVANQVVEAVGTEFDVERRGKVVDVAVAEGIVAVAQLRVGEGQAVSLAEGGAAGQVRKVSVDQVGAWRTGMLIYQNRPFAAVVAGLNRAFDGTMRIDDPALAQRRVTVSIALKDRKTTLETLQFVLPVRAVFVRDDTVVFVPKESSR